MTLHTTIDDLATTNPQRLASLLQSLVLHNPEARRYVAAMVEPITCWQDLDAVDGLTEDQKSAIWNANFEYNGDDE